MKGSAAVDFAAPPRRTTRIWCARVSAPAQSSARGAGGNQSAVHLARKYPQEFVFFANAVPDDPNARREIEKFLKAGALGIGEQKYALECDSEPMQRIFAIAQDHQIPVLLHFQHGVYNLGIERFHLGFDYLADFRRAISAVTPQDVLDVARKHLDPDHMVLIVAGAVDEKGKVLSKEGNPR